MDAFETYEEEKAIEKFYECRKAISDIAREIASFSETQLKIIRPQFKRAASHEEDAFSKELWGLFVTHCDRCLERVRFWKAGSGKWRAVARLSEWNDPLKTCANIEPIEEIICDSKTLAVEKIRELAIKHANRNGDLRHVEVEIYPENWED